jgi:hypothetical protein
MHIKCMLWFESCLLFDIDRISAIVQDARHGAAARAADTHAIDCTVLNLSDVGACLKVESPIGIPDTFDLMLDHAPVRGCRVTWRKATQIGVEFG